MSLNDAEDLVTMSSGGEFNTVYGLNVFNGRTDRDSCYEWIFNLMVGSQYAHICIGIDNLKNIKDHKDSWLSVLGGMSSNEGDYYAYSVVNGTFYGPGTGVIDRYAVRVNFGGMFKMVLNFKEKTLVYWRGDVCLGVAAKDIELKDEEYSMAISISGRQSKVQLMSFKRIYLGE